MRTIHFLCKHFLFATVATIVTFSLAGCSSSQANKAPSAEDLQAFNGANGKMPDDFKAKLQAAQQNGASAQQQASQAAQQKAAQQPAKP